MTERYQSNTDSSEALMRLAEQDALAAHEAEQQAAQAYGQGQHTDHTLNPFNPEQHLIQYQAQTTGDPIVSARIPLGGGQFTEQMMDRQTAINSGFEIMTPDVIQQASLRHPEDVPEAEPQGKIDKTHVSGLAQLILEGRLTNGDVVSAAKDAGVSIEQMAGAVEQQQADMQGRVTGTLERFGLNGEDAMKVLYERSPKDFTEAVMDMIDGNGSFRLANMAEKLQNDAIHQAYNDSHWVSRMKQAGHDVMEKEGLYYVMLDDGYMRFEDAVRKGHVTVDVY